LGSSITNGSWLPSVSGRSQASARSQAAGFARGNVRPAALKSAVALAERHGVTAEQIRAALTDAGGGWPFAVLPAIGEKRTTPATNRRTCATRSHVTVGENVEAIAIHDRARPLIRTHIHSFSGPQLG
jgi:hypothetical protein